MELQVYLIIVTVFLVSLFSLLFVNRQLRAGKTFEEVLAEKRQLTDKLYGNKKKNTKKANTGKKVSIHRIQNLNLKKQANFRKFSDQYEKKIQNRDRKDAKQSKAAAIQQPSAVESDGKSDSGSEIDSNVTDGKAHVEFTEEEIIAPETNTVQFKVCILQKKKFQKLCKIFDHQHLYFHSVNCQPARQQYRLFERQAHQNHPDRVFL